MRYWTGGALAFFLALFQASSIEQFKILGVAPNLLLVLLVSWLVVRGLDDVLPMLAVSGVTLSLVGLQMPGVVLLALLPIAGLGIVREMHVVHSDLLLVLAFVIVASVAYELVLLLYVIATGGGLDIVTALRTAVVPAALVNLALTPPVFAVMRLAKASPRRQNRFSY
jgi:hypothetical protein